MVLLLELLEFPLSPEPADEHVVTSPVQFRRPIVADGLAAGADLQLNLHLVAA